MRPPSAKSESPSADNAKATVKPTLMNRSFKFRILRNSAVLSKNLIT